MNIPSNGSAFRNTRFKQKQASLTLAVLLVISLFQAGCGQTDTSQYRASVKASADSMAQFLLKKEYTSFARFTHPKIIEMLGGREKMIQVISQSLSQMDSSGFKITGVVIGAPGPIIRADNQLQCILTQNMQMNVNGKTNATLSNLVAVSFNEGKSWVFIDCQKKNLEEVRNVFPELSNKLEIPDRH
ncbi:MAG TPA: hypothetical protein VNZ86_08605 [Bacteroidia bacterium]|jgi:hypothetical protein|nr:hypothetical protein [Bacteroidia bacterium]